MSPLWIKTCGYLISSVSVVLLAIVAWPKADQPILATVLVAGAGASILGMALRWLSYWIEERRKPEARGKP